MSETTPDREEQVVEQAQPDHEEQVVEQAADDRPGREAARYRRQLRETEAERDTLRASLDALRQATAEDALAAHLTRPAALWLTGATAGEFYTEDGVLDRQRLADAAQAAVRDHGLAPVRRFQGSGDGGARTTTPAPKSWADALRG